MLGTTAVVAVAGAAGAAAGFSLARVREAEAQPAPPRALSPHSSSEIAPGELDEYYVFSSSGQTGEISHSWSAVDARANADSGVQSLQRDRLGTHE